MASPEFKKAVRTQKAYRIALRGHNAAVRAHTTAVAKLPPVISNGTVDRKAVLQRLCLMWVQNPNKVKESDGIGKYIKGGPGVMSAYAQVLDQSPEFQPDGLHLQTNDTAFVTTVGQLIDAIARWYLANKK